MATIKEIINIPSTLVELLGVFATRLDTLEARTAHLSPPVDGVADGLWASMNGGAPNPTQPNAAERERRVNRCHKLVARLTALFKHGHDLAA
jgi:hypothetical protein